MKETMDFFKFMTIIRKKWIWVMLASLIGLAASYGVTQYVLSPQYAAVTRMIVSRNYIDDQTVELGDIQTNIQLISTYRDIIKDPVVLDQVRENLSFSISEEELANNIMIQIQNDSQIFGISVTGDTPEQAAEMTNLIAMTFQENVGQIINVDNVSILSPARADPDPVSPRLLINVVIGSFVGFLTGVMICLAGYVMDKKVYNEQEVYDLLEWTNLGAISELTVKKKKRTTKNKSPKPSRPVMSMKDEGAKENSLFKEGTSHV